tara:strand:+ start:3466 stop:4539 length:1074 start_codon:yes stop_codon:yes gene_type:complete
MSVYLGSSGLIDLRRTSDGASFECELDKASIDDKAAGSASDKTRLISIWSAPLVDQNDKVSIMGRPKTEEETPGEWEEYMSVAQLSTGDLITMKSTDNTNLSFVKGKNTGTSANPTYAAWDDKSFSCYVYVDEMGSIRLYDAQTSQLGFKKSLDGKRSEALELVEITGSTKFKIKITIESGIYRPIGQVTSYEVNTNRETIDITSLSDQFRQQYSALMTGSGRFTCMWDYLSLGRASHYGRTSDVDANYQDNPRYIQELLLRANIGSAFMAKFFLKTATGTSGTQDDLVWYKVKGIMTNVAVSFDLADVIKMTAQFVTTGPFFIQSATETEYILLQEDGFDILATDDDKIISSKDTA